MVDFTRLKDNSRRFKAQAYAKSLLNHPVQSNKRDKIDDYAL